MLEYKVFQRQYFGCIFYETKKTFFSELIPPGHMLLTDALFGSLQHLHQNQVDG